MCRHPGLVNLCGRMIVERLAVGGSVNYDRWLQFLAFERTDFLRDYLTLNRMRDDLMKTPFITHSVNVEQARSFLFEKFLHNDPNQSLSVSAEDEQRAEFLAAIGALTRTVDKRFMVYDCVVCPIFVLIYIYIFSLPSDFVSVGSLLFT